MLIRVFLTKVHRPSKWLGEYFAGPNLLKVIWEVVKKKWKSIFGKLKNLKTTEIVLSFLDQWPPATFFLRKLYEGKLCVECRLGCCIFGRFLISN